jgi:hypothetical protein
VESFGTSALAAINAEADTALSDYDPPTKTEMDTAFTEIKGGTWSATDTLEAIRDRGDAAWTTADVSTLALEATVGALNNLSIADIRTAVGLAAANLDTQLAALQTDLDNPAQYKADVSALALEATVAALNDLSSAQAQAAVTAALDAISSTALARFASVDSGEVTTVAGSVAKLAQGAAGGDVTVGDFTQAALAKFADTDTGETAVVAGSVADLAKSEGGGGGSYLI